MLLIDIYVCYNWLLFFIWSRGNVQR